MYDCHTRVIEKNSTTELLAPFHACRRQETAIPAANRVAERATSLDPNLAEAYATLGLLRSWYDWKWDEAAVFFRRAIDLNPGYATAHFWYGFHYLAMTGRLEEALP